MKILVVEDDSDIQFALRLILEIAGYQLSFADHGAAALETLAREGLPDLILLDMLMPVMDGWEFAREFHRLYDKRVPLVVMTAASDAARRAKDADAEGFVSKPFKVEELLEAVALQIRRPQQKKVA